MNKADIQGVVITPLSIVPGEDGQVMHMLRSDAAHFRRFGEIYFSCIYPRVVKGWKLHSASWSNMAVPTGRIKFVLHDTREASPTKGAFQEILLGDNRYALLTIPPGVAYAWKNLLPTVALVANCATEAWSPNEAKNIPIKDIAYEW